MFINFSRKRKLGCLGTKQDARNYERKFLFGAGDRPVPGYFEAPIAPVIKKQGQTMACTYFSFFGQALPIKIFMESNEEIIVTNERIMEFWNEGCSQGLGNKKNGAYVQDPCKFLQKNPQEFQTKSGKTITVSVDKYFVLDDWEADEEMYYGGVVLTGSNSRMGASMKTTGSSPYFIEAKKRPISDGHAHPQIGKRKQERYDPIKRVWEKVVAHVHPNSWGDKWGDGGYMYSGEDVQKPLFDRIGFTIKIKFEGEVIPPPVGQFPDIEKNSYYYESIIKASNKGILNGYPDGTMRPGAPVSRAELAVILDRLKLLD